MAISDYLMSRLAAAQGARQSALQLEQAKAAREAAAQRATTGYIQQLLQAGGSLATQLPQQIAADEAAALAKLDQEIALRARAGAGDIEEPSPISDTQPSISIPTKPQYDLGMGKLIPPTLEGQAKTFDQLVKEAPQTSANIPYTDAQMAKMTSGYGGEGVYSRRAIEGDEFKAIPTASIPPSEETLPPDAPRKPVSPGTPEVSKAVEDQVAANKALAALGLSPRLPGEKTGGGALGLKGAAERVGKAYVMPSPSMETRTIEPTGTPITPKILTRRDEIRAAVTDLPMMRNIALQEAEAARTSQTPIPGMKGITLQDITGLIVQETPVEPEAKKEYVDTVLPDIPDFKLQTGLDLYKPAVAEAVENAKTEYVPLRFKTTTDEAAEIIAKQVEDRLPRDNPLTKFFLFGKSSGNYERAREMAKLKAKVLIQEERKAASADHMKSYLNSLDVTKREAEIGLIRAKTILDQSKSENVVKFKTDLPSTERGKLQGFDLAQKSLGNLAETTRDALEEGKGLPIGTDRLIAQAYVKANAAKQGSDAASISAGTGVLGGANLSISQSVSGKPLDEALLMDAFESVDRSKWTPKQKLMHMEKFKTIQNLGKALEGGKLTDADYKKYVEILVNSDDPQTYLMSINRLMKDNYENYSNYKTNLGGTYEERVLAGFDPKEPTSLFFNEDEINKAFAAPIGAAAQSLAETGAKYRGPGTVLSPLVGGAAAQIQALANKAAALAASGDIAGAAAVRAEIDKIKAGNKPKPAPEKNKSSSVFK